MGRSVGHWGRNVVLVGRNHPPGRQFKQLHRQARRLPDYGHARDGQLRPIRRPCRPIVGIAPLQRLGQNPGPHVPGQSLIASTVRVDQAQVAAVINVRYPVHHRDSISIMFGLNGGPLCIVRDRLRLAAAQKRRQTQSGDEAKQQLDPCHNACSPLGAIQAAMSS